MSLGNANTSQILMCVPELRFLLKSGCRLNGSRVDVRISSPEKHPVAADPRSA